MEHIKDEQFDRVASGHYARVERVANNNEDQVTQLHLSADEVQNFTFLVVVSLIVKLGYMCWGCTGS